MKFQRKTLEPLLATTRRGRIAQGVTIVAAITLAILFRIGAPRPPTVPAAAAERALDASGSALIPPAAIESLKAAFPVGASDAAPAQFFGEFTHWISALGLTLESRSVERITAPNGKVRRVFSRVGGTTKDQLELLRRILHRDPAIELRSFRWDRGDAATRRILELTLDVPEPLE